MGIAVQLCNQIMSFLHERNYEIENKEIVFCLGEQNPLTKRPCL